MNSEFEDLLVDFEKSLTKAKIGSYMPVLKNSLLPYLESNCLNGESADNYFKFLIAPEHIIKGGIDYVDHTDRVKSRSAIDKYLTASSEFFKTVVFPKWPSCPLVTADNFKIYHNQISNGCRKNLKKYSARAHLSQGDYNCLYQFLKNLKDTSIRSLMAKAVISLTLLYGFKIGTIAEIKRKEFDENARTITINVGTDRVKLELPCEVCKSVSAIYHKKISEEYLFNTAENQKLDSAYINAFVAKYNKEKVSSDARITLDGIAKYAVINMLCKGLNPIVISQITGMKGVHLDYCQKEAWKMTKKKMNLNEYVNFKLRSIGVYDDFN